MNINELPLARLHAHPLNSNVMPKALIEKLAAHLERSGRYPPVIVRPLGDDWQILDGHHRVQALRRLDRDTVRCDVWEVDDAEALLLLATLNRLQGQDDPYKRAVLVEALAARRGMTLPQLSRELPERSDQLKALAGLSERVRSASPRPVADQRVVVHFFLLPADRSELEEALSATGGPREQVLMRWARGER